MVVINRAGYDWEMNLRFLVPSDSYGLSTGAVYSKCIKWSCRHSFKLNLATLCVKLLPRGSAIQRHSAHIVGPTLRSLESKVT